ncbi:MAG: hypothetical protein GY757_59510, partial [bacterium]|nr:hypothetical protein [bacterium]
FVKIDRIPLTPNGKIDQKALEQIQDTKFPTKTYIAPRNKIEESLTEIWTKILKIPRETIGIDSDFFQLGGHSLKATRMVTVIHKEFAVNISLAEIFKNPSIRTLANNIKGMKKEEYANIEPVEKKEYYPLTSTQKKPFIGLEKVGEDSVHHNQSYIYILEGKLDTTKFDETFDTIVQRHENLRTSFHIVNGRAVQRVNDIAFQVTHSRGTEEDRQEMTKQFVKPFDLSRAPLLRVQLMQVEEEKYYVFFEMHHIISDATSIGIMLREFITIYHDIPLEPLPIQFKDYATWQEAQLEKPLFREQEKYWLKKMEGFQYTQLPYDTPPAEEVMECDSETLHFEAEHFESIKEYCSRGKITRFTFVMAVL